jgi:hypothetical protein
MPDDLISMADSKVDGPAVGTIDIDKFEKEEKGKDGTDQNAYYDAMDPDLFINEKVLHKVVYWSKQLL